MGPCWLGHEELLPIGVCDEGAAGKSNRIRDEEGGCKNGRGGVGVGGELHVFFNFFIIFFKRLLGWGLHVYFCKGWGSGRKGGGLYFYIILYKMLKIKYKVVNVFY